MRAILAQRFHRVTPGYGLIYTDGPQPAGTIEVSGEDLNRLTDADRAWLFSCNVSIIAKAAAESAEETKKRMGELMDMVEAELKTVRKEDKANG